VNRESHARTVPRVGFHFDVMCPWAYEASVWIRDVRSRTPLEVEWRFFSLEEINRAEGKKHPWERPWSYGWGMLRVAALLRRSSMDDCDRFYAAAGRALHVEGRKPHHPDVAAEIVESIGLNPGVVESASAVETTHADVKADHDEIVAHGGFGVPTLVFDDGSHLYGPVMTPAPAGEDVLRLWDLVCATRRFPHLYELKRPKTDADVVFIADRFAPYLSARDWETREKPAR
jgi:2-hydroxychromene-2-carboxylate isomerase